MTGKSICLPGAADAANHLTEFRRCGGVASASAKAASIVCRIVFVVRVKRKSW